ncbi:MAG: TatD family hydrolase [Rhizomicrobium sp.]
MLVDSHCHLDFDTFQPELDAVVQRARDAGVKTCVSIGTKLDKFPGVRAVAERFSDVWCSVGVHPHEAEGELLDNAAILIDHAKHPKVVGIGETGLDYYYEHRRAISRSSISGITSTPRGKQIYRSSCIRAMPMTIRSLS